MARYIFEGDHSDVTGNGHDAVEAGTFFIQGDTHPLADLMDTDPERGGVYSYTWDEVFYDWGNGGSPRNNRINLEGALPLPNVPADTGITLMAWVKREAVHSVNNGGSVHDGSIFQLGNCGDQAIATMGIRTDGTLTGYIEGDLVAVDGEQVLVESDSFVPPNEWHHLTLVFDRVNNLATSYVDAVAQTSPDDISTVGDGEMDFDRAYIGSFCSGGKAFVGQIDDARIYYGVLSATEIADIHSANAPPAITSFSADSDFLPSAGPDVTLSWSVSDQCELKLDPGGIVIPDVDTSMIVAPTETTTYTLTARAGSAFITRSVTVLVAEPPVIESFTADRSAARPGAEVSFSWQVSGADTVSIDHDVDIAVPRSLLGSTTTFTLTATNSVGPSTAQVIVEVTPVAEATFLIDFSDTNAAAGRPNTAAADGNFWNVFPNFHNGQLDALVDTSNDAGQGIRLSVVDPFAQLSNNAADGADAFTENAATDGFLTDVIESDGYAELLLENLGRTGATVYDLTFFSSIGEIVGVDLVQRYTVIGRATSSVTLDTNGNVSETVTAVGVVPAVDGTILIQMQPDSPAGLGAGINVMQIDSRLELPPFRVTSIKRDPVTDRPTIRWNAVPGRRYSAERSPDMAEWDEEEDNLRPTGIIGLWEDPSPLTGSAFYRILEFSEE